MRGSAAISFGLVCFLSGSLWLMPTVEVTQTAELFQFALSGTLSFALLGLVCSFGKDDSREISQTHWRLALSGVGTVATPTLLLWIGRHNLSSVMAVASQVSVPVVVAIATATIGAGSELQTQLIPSLIGLTGALLILPVALPGSATGWIGLACYGAAAACSGMSSILCHQEMTRVSPRRALLTVAGANAIVLSVFAAVWIIVTATWHEAFATLSVPSLLSMAAQSISMAGVLLILRALSPLAFASRFIFIPLLATVEAFFLLHIPLSPRACLGAALMLLGGAACLRADAAMAPSPRMSLR